MSVSGFLHEVLSNQALGKLKEKQVKKATMIAGALLASVIFTGCATGRDSGQPDRDFWRKEYARLAALPPGRMVVSSDPHIAGIARTSCDVFTEVQSIMKAYVDKTESSREYTGFMNDVAYYVKEEKLSNADACKKVHDAVVAADANRPADQQVWPKIAKGIAAANELEPAKQLARLALLTVRNQTVARDVKKLKHSFKGDFMTVACRTLEIVAICDQTMDSVECLVFLGEQFRRVLVLENYAR